MSRIRCAAALTVVAVLFVAAFASAQEYYQKDNVELEVNRTASEDAYLTFTRRDGFQPPERLVLGLAVAVQKDQGETGAGVAPSLKIAFRKGEVEVTASGALDTGGDAAKLSGVYQLESAEELTRTQKARSTQLDDELNRVYGEVRAKLTPARAAELKDLQREWIHSVYSPNTDAAAREDADGEYWRNQADQAADRIKFLRDFATGKVNSGPPSLQAQLKAAEEAEAWPAVAEIARHMLENNVKDSALWEKRARAFANLEDWKRCGATIDEWAKVTQQKLPAMDGIRGDVAFGESRKQDAIDLWSACARGAPKDVGTRDKLARLLGEFGNWSEAAKILEQRVKAQPEPSAYANLAIAYGVLGDWKSAGINIRRGSGLDATNDDVHHTLPRVERAEKALPEVKKIEKAIADTPQGVGSTLEHGLLFLNIGWPEITLKDGNQALHIWAESRCGLLQKAVALIALQRTDEAQELEVDTSEESMKNEAVLHALAKADVEVQSTGSAAALGRRAHHLNRAGQYALSDKDTEAALKLDANCDAALAAKAEALVAHSKELEALPLAEQAVKINPRNQLAWYLQGKINVMRHNFADAVDALTKVLELAPTDIESLTLRWRCYRELGKVTEAEADYSRRISLEKK